MYELNKKCDLNESKNKYQNLIMNEKKGQKTCANHNYSYFDA